MEAEKDFPGTLRKIAEMGFEGVEFDGYYGMTGHDLRKTLDDLGLKCFGSHIGVENFASDAFQKTVDFNLAVGNKYLIIPGLPENMRDTNAHWKQTAQFFNSLAEKLKPFGLRTGFHNHHTEFA